ncbi:MAG: lysine 2,3-aminomutase, partial [Anaerolineales bacterium]|nr:lysine 2,3-aminomutase [Anaerolineales bacterium]
ADLVAGTGHFRTPVSKGVEIIEGLRGHTSGYAIPTYVVDAPGGGGKIPLAPNYQLSQSDHKVVLRNFEGFVTSYEEPSAYTGHDPATCTFCQNKRSEPGQRGISGLLDGEAMSIQPEGFDATHRRGGEQHRLRLNPSEWQPLGIGENAKVEVGD